MVAMTYQMSLAMSSKTLTSASTPEASQLNRSPISTRVPSARDSAASVTVAGAASARGTAPGGVGEELRCVYALASAWLDWATPRRSCGDVPGGTKSLVDPSRLTICAVCRTATEVYCVLRCQAVSIVFTAI